MSLTLKSHHLCCQSFVFFSFLFFYLEVILSRHKTLSPWLCRDGVVAGKLLLWLCLGEEPLLNFARLCRGEVPL
jgi:hypothetical protein